MNAHTNLFSDSDDIYLLAHSIGKMPRSTPDYCAAHFFDPWRSNRDDIWPQWLQKIDLFKAALARLFNASENEFCPQSNVSSGLSKVLSALRKQSGKQVIVMSEHDFPSAGFVLQQAQRFGYQLRVLDKQQDPQNLAVWESAIRDDVAAVFITHVHYNTNKRIPVAEISKAARAKEALSIVDVAQSSGIVPIDFKHWQTDVVVGSCIKWLCGGPGAGFLWISPTLIEQLEPVDLGWFSHQNPFEFDINHFEYADDSKRFWGGTPSVLPFITATNSINTLLDIGIDSVQAHNQRLSEKIIQGLSPSVIVSPQDLNQKGGTTVLNFPELETISNRLQARGILFDAREFGIRLSPHIYTTDDEIDTLIECFQ